MVRRIRGDGSPETVVIYWRDLPAQVNAQLGRERQQVLLEEKFQRAIDRAKRKAKIVTAQDDVAQWRRVSAPCGPDLAAEAAAVAARLDQEYSIERLGRLAFAGGFESTDGAASVDASALADLEELDDDATDDRDSNDEDKDGA